jgi:hypothetical protein
VAERRILNVKKPAVRKETAELKDSLKSHIRDKLCHWFSEYTHASSLIAPESREGGFFYILSD